jgi:hypothetical protein
MLFKWSWFCFGRMYENTNVLLTPSVIGKLKYSTLILTANEKGDISGPRQLLYVVISYNERSHRAVQSKIIFLYIRVVYTKAVQLQYVNIPKKIPETRCAKCGVIFRRYTIFPTPSETEHSWLLAWDLTDGVPVRQALNIQSRKLKSRYGARIRFQEPSLELSSQGT